MYFLKCGIVPIDHECFHTPFKLVYNLVWFFYSGIDIIQKICYFRIRTYVRSQRRETYESYNLLSGMPSSPV